MGVIGYHDKPVNANLIATIIRSFAGWVTFGGAEKTINADNILIANELVIDMKCYRALYHDRIIALTPKEFGILLALVRHPEFVFSRMQLL